MIEIVHGDMLAVDADVAVLSAHPTLIAGSGLSGYFHREAGPELEEAAQAGPLQPGHSVVTEGYRLNAPRVVHAVAPRYLQGSEQEQATLGQTYLSVFQHDELADCKRIVFPAIGVGIYRWPASLAASIALSALRKAHSHKPLSVYMTLKILAYEKLVASDK